MFSQVSIVFRRSPMERPDADDGIGKPNVDAAVAVCVIVANSASVLHP